MKRVFGIVEVVFDILYILTVLLIGSMLLIMADDNQARLLAGIMALVLVIGDAFHLIPRINLIFTGREEYLRRALGRGKQITSITMAVFYVLLWHIGLIVLCPENILIWSSIIYILATLRIFLCLLPDNKWEERYPPVSWGILRNIPFFLQGIMVAGLFFQYRNMVQGLEGLWLGIVLSFLFYLPVVLWANKNPKVGMFMLPKTCVYLWMLIICLRL